MQKSPEERDEEGKMLLGQIVKRRPIFQAIEIQSVLYLLHYKSMMLYMWSERIIKHPVIKKIKYCAKFND